MPSLQPLTVASAASGMPGSAFRAAQMVMGSLIAYTTSNPLPWLLNGNSGVASGFLGTTDRSPLVLKVNNRQAMRYSYAERIPSAGQSYRSINVLGGSDINSISAGVVGATIAGGGSDGFTPPDFPNRVTADFGTIGGGEGNVVSGFAAFIGGGQGNTASRLAATVAGGQSNIASELGATVGGGSLNIASGQGATIGGGGFNTASGIVSIIGGGATNTASGTAATVGGGQGNFATGLAAFVGGGRSNVASGPDAAIGGGQSNLAAGNVSFAAGYRAKAYHPGTFVWGDSANADFASTAANQFLIRASGGVGLALGTFLDTGFGVPGHAIHAGCEPACNNDPDLGVIGVQS